MLHRGDKTAAKATREKRERPAAPLPTVTVRPATTDDPDARRAVVALLRELLDVR